MLRPADRLAAIALLGATASAQTASAPDASFATFFQPSADRTTLTVESCTSDKSSNPSVGTVVNCNVLGNYPFQTVGAVLDGTSSTIKDGQITRPLYVLEVGVGPQDKGVQLTVLTQTEIKADPFSAVELNPAHIVSLPTLRGGKNATGFAAENDRIIVAGTDNAQGATVIIDKRSFEVRTITPAEMSPFPPSPITGISADAKGNISIAHGGGQMPFSVVLDPTGQQLFRGFNAQFLPAAAASAIGPRAAASGQAATPVSPQ